MELNLQVWRNERTFYSGKCASCGSVMVSLFSPNSPLKIWCNKCWWSDKFNAVDYGRDFDFTRPFFDQFWELMNSTPIGQCFIANSENSEYSNYAVGNKNCYMASASDYNQDSFYTDNSNYNRDCCDVSMVNKSELCYESVDLVNSYTCLRSQNLTNCNFCFFCADLIGCANCIGCVGLRNMEYAIFNKKLSKEEYENILRNMALNTHSGTALVQSEFNKFRLNQPRKFSNNLNAENCTGNYIVNSKNCKNCFDIQECQDCEDLIFGYKSKNCKKVYGTSELELAYLSVASVGSYNINFSCLIWPGSSDLYYNFCARIAKNCFGCVAPHRNEYCILNKQYSPEKYKEMFEKIKHHMERTGEWGQFFPMKYSPWSYNETIAQDFYPLVREEALKLGARWEDNMPGTFGKGTIKTGNIPDNIKLVSPEISNEIFECEICSRNYKIISQEFLFYKKLGIPLPRKCPQCRYRARMNLRTPRELHERKCMNSGCQNDFLTAYSSDRPEKIYCESCYQGIL